MSVLEPIKTLKWLKSNGDITQDDIVVEVKEESFKITRGHLKLHKPVYFESHRIVVVGDGNGSLNIVNIDRFEFLHQYHHAMRDDVLDVIKWDDKSIVACTYKQFKSFSVIPPYDVLWNMGMSSYYPSFVGLLKYSPDIFACQSDPTNSYFTPNEMFFYSYSQCLSGNSSGHKFEFVLKLRDIGYNLFYFMCNKMILSKTFKTCIYLALIGTNGVDIVLMNPRSRYISKEFISKEKSISNFHIFQNDKEEEYLLVLHLSQDISIFKTTKKKKKSIVVDEDDDNTKKKIAFSIDCFSSVIINNQVFICFGKEKKISIYNNLHNNNNITKIYEKKFEDDDDETRNNNNNNGIVMINVTNKNKKKKNKNYEFLYGIDNGVFKMMKIKGLHQFFSSVNQEQLDFEDRIEFLRNGDLLLTTENGKKNCDVFFYIKLLDVMINYKIFKSMIC